MDLNNQLDHRLFSMEESSKYWFLEGFRYGRKFSNESEMDADNWFGNVIIERRTKRNIISAVQTDSGHKVTDNSNTPRDVSQKELI